MPTPRTLAAGVLVGLCAVAVGACGDGDDDGDADLPLVAEIAPAVEALEEELGDSPQYFEIRATSEYVTLWVSADQGRLAIPYPYANGELGDPGDSAAASGYTFAAVDGLAFDPDAVLDQVDEDLDTPLTQFSILGTESGAPRYAVTARSDRGGEIDIQVDAVGTPLEAVPVD